MRLLVEELLRRFQEVWRQDCRDPLVIAKFFTPDAGWTWYTTEYDPEDGIFFGFVVGLEREWGYFSLSELELARGPLGLEIERDMWFEERRFSGLSQ